MPNFFLNGNVPLFIERRPPRVHKIFLQTFEGPKLSLLIKSNKLSFSNTNTVCLLITREIFLKITKHQPTDGDKLNIAV